MKCVTDDLSLLYNLYIFCDLTDFADYTDFVKSDNSDQQSHPTTQSERLMSKTLHIPIPIYFEYET